MTQFASKLPSGKTPTLSSTLSNWPTNNASGGGGFQPVFTPSASTPRDGVSPVLAPKRRNRPSHSSCWDDNAWLP